MERSLAQTGSRTAEELLAELEALPGGEHGRYDERYQLARPERAVRLFQEHVHEYPSRWVAMQSIAGKIGCTAETLRAWVQRAEADRTRIAALADRQRLKQLEWENPELKRANEILRKASAPFA